MENRELAQLNWRKSRFSGMTNCVEVATTPSIVALRDSKDPESPVLRYPVSRWTDFLEAAKSGTFDYPA
jgi:hypothetical protein